ncbi:putative malate dehydrogenase (decarboxylating) [Helianthus anomalus]
MPLSIFGSAPFAKPVDEVQSIGLREGSDLLEVVKKVKPHVLVGLSGVGGIFNEQVLKAMRDLDSPKPAIFAMSNPTDNAECTAADAFMHAGENIVFGSVSPFQNVDLGNGKVGYVNQANNMYLFPGYVFILCYLLLLICYILFNIIWLLRTVIYRLNMIISTYQPHIIIAHVLIFINSLRAAYD